MINEFMMYDANEWGYESYRTTPKQIVDNLIKQLKFAQSKYEALPEGPEQYGNTEYYRVFVNIGVSDELYDQFFNSRAGYRAQYCISKENGEAFNKYLVNKIAPIIIESSELYKGNFDPTFCQMSLCGEYSKFWFAKDVTDPLMENYLNGLEEVITAGRWKKYWKSQTKPWKGLLAPNPKEKNILFNGTFVKRTVRCRINSKPNRSNEIFESGWT